MSAKPVRGRLAQRVAAAGGDVSKLPPLHDRSPLWQTKSANDTDTSSTDECSSDTSFSGSPEVSRKRLSLSTSGRKPTAEMITVLGDLNTVFASLREIARPNRNYGHSDIFSRINAFIIDGNESAEEMERKLMHAALGCVDALDECTRLVRQTHRRSVQLLVEHVLDNEIEYADRTAHVVAMFARDNPESPRGPYHRPKQRRRRRSPRSGDDNSSESDHVELPFDEPLKIAGERRNSVLKHLRKSLDADSAAYADALVRIDDARQRLLRAVETTQFHEDVEEAVTLIEVNTKLQESLKQ